MSNNYHTTQHQQQQEKPQHILEQDQQLNQEQSPQNYESHRPAQSQNDSPQKLAFTERGAPTEARRKYPKDPHERKNEWEAIEYHKGDINSQIRQAEQQIKNYRQKELMTELDRKLIDNLERKQQLLKQKHQEAEQQQLNYQQYVQQKQQQIQDKKALGSMMNAYYNDQRTDKLSKEQQTKQQQIEWEKNLLDYNQKRLQEEREKQKEYKNYLLHEKDADVQRALAQKELEKQNKQQFTQEYRQIMEQNAQKEKLKEDNYRKFFQMASDHQNYKNNQHVQKVLEPTIQRNNNVNNIIEKNYQSYQKKQADDELQRFLDRQQQYRSTNNQNVNIMYDHQQQKNIQHIEKDKRVKERLDDLDKYNQFVDLKKKEKQDRQNEYKSYLDQQANEKYEQDQGKLRMTRTEKNLNKQDLQAYKSYDPGMYSMLPGWSPQVGQLPPRQNRDIVQQQILTQARQQSKQGQTQKDWQKQYENTLQNEQKQNDRYQKQEPFQKVGEPISKYNASSIYEKKQPNVQSGLSMRNNSTAVLSYGHNPITNPMPNNIQNPYISKEYQRAQRMNNYSSVGANSPMSNSLVQAGGNLAQQQ